MAKTLSAWRKRIRTVTDVPRWKFQRRLAYSCAIIGVFVPALYVLRFWTMTHDLFLSFWLALLATAPLLILSLWFGLGVWGGAKKLEEKYRKEMTKEGDNESIP